VSTGVREPTPAAADRLTDVYLANYYPLIRLAALLVDGVAACEEIVQEAYVRVYSRRPKLRDETRALGYLQQAVLCLSRSSPRRARTSRTHTDRASTAAAGADARAVEHIEQAAVVQAFRRLPRRRREVLALRFYAELSEAQVAGALQLSVGSVRTHSTQGLDRLAREMAGMA
jgi:RNA polymerase sigma factor (sigma-70 family)